MEVPVIETSLRCWLGVMLGGGSGRALVETHGIQHRQDLMSRPQAGRGFGADEAIGRE